jgi:hypothetical protein
VAFVYVNGLNLVKFEEWYKFQGLVGNDAVVFVSNISDLPCVKFVMSILK